MYHGIIIDQEFKDPSFINFFKIFNKKQDGDWLLCGIEVENGKVNRVISKIQENMKLNQPWYAHLYNDEELIVIFKNKIFHLKTHASSWQPAVEYGKSLNIPPEQLDFWPNRFQDEKHYF